MLSCPFIVPLLSPAGKRLTSWLLLVMFIVIFCYFPMWYPRSGVVLNCIVSSSLPSFLLSLSERVVIDGHGCHTALHFGVKAKENQDKVPLLYWLPNSIKNL